MQDINARGGEPFSLDDPMLDGLAVGNTTRDEAVGHPQEKRITRLVPEAHVALGNKDSPDAGQSCGRCSEEHRIEEESVDYVDAMGSEEVCETQEPNQCGKRAQ